MGGHARGMPGGTHTPGCVLNSRVAQPGRVLCLTNSGFTRTLLGVWLRILECKSNGGTAQVRLTVQSLMEPICTLFGPLKNEFGVAVCTPSIHHSLSFTIHAFHRLIHFISLFSFLPTSCMNISLVLPVAASAVREAM